MSEQNQNVSLSYNTSLETPMTLSDWVITLVLSFIPIVNIILLFVWAFGSNTNINKKNYAKAQLLMFLIMIVLYFLFFASLLGGIMSSL